jgi:glycosyltransferase involved in cell wall biosynthesis
MPKISFVIPTKNRADMIREALSSLIAQTESAWEAIVVDDHGRDRTEDVIRQLADGRICYLRLPDGCGQGVAAARNFGNLAAQSELLAVLDSDDIAKPHRAERTLSSYTELGWDFYCAREETEGPLYGLPLTTPQSLPVQWDSELFKTFSYVTHSTIAYTKRAALEIPYNSALPLLEDYDLISRFIELQKKMYYDTEVVVTYRRHPQSVTATHERGLRARYLHAIRSWRGWEAPAVDSRDLTNPPPQAPQGFAPEPELFSELEDSPEQPPHTEIGPAASGVPQGGAHMP